MKTAACMIVKNEEGGIAEWMAYHLAIGFDALIVFDNASTDRTAQVIETYARRHDIRRVNWDNTTPRYQMEAYDFALASFGAEFDWIAFIDCDEFILPRRDASIGAFLDSLPDGPAVAMNWAIFGSSGHVMKPDGLLIENFQRRSDESFGINRHVKSIVRPAQTRQSANPHYFDVRGGYLTPRGTPLEWESPGITLAAPDFEVIQVNHYFVRSAEQWQQKLRRGYHDVERTGSEFVAYDRNEVEDPAILRFLSTTKAIMALTTGSEAG